MLPIIVVELLLFVGVVIADAQGWIPLTQTIVLLPLVALALRRTSEPWSNIGWRAPQAPSTWGRAVGLGITAGAAMELLALWVTTPLISAWLGSEPDHSGLAAIRGNAQLLLLFLALSWTLAAFGEEICFRGFLMQRCATLLGGSRTAWWASLVLSSVLFGWGHTEQGAAGWIQEGLSGLLLGVLFLATGRNLVVPIVAHGVANTLAFVLIYLGRYPGIA